MILSDSNSGPWLYDRKHHQEFGDRYLDLLRVRGAATTIEIAKALGVNRVTAFGCMSRRHALGLVTCSYVPRIKGGGIKDAWWRLL